MILFIGCVAIAAYLLFEHEEASKAASAAQANADAGIYAAEGQASEITDIPPGGQLPANSLTEANNTQINEFVGEAN